MRRYIRDADGNLYRRVGFGTIPTIIGGIILLAFMIYDQYPLYQIVLMALALVVFTGRCIQLAIRKKKREADDQAAKEAVENHSEQDNSGNI